MSTTKAILNPLSSLHVSSHQIPRHGRIPNTSIHNKPLLIYHNAFSPSGLTPTQIESHIESIGVCAPQWRYTMYGATHFHSTTHELLVVFKGSARLLFGGEGNPRAIEVDVGKGDAILVPAGVGHTLLEGRGGFEMVGSYPVEAKRWDMCYGKEGEEAEDTIRALKWIDRDPLYGDHRPALSV